MLNRYVAVKLMGQSLASDPGLRDRFMREAQAAGSLQHPNIITIFDFGEAEGHLYIAMEFIEGSDLSEIMERRDPLSLPAKLDIIIDVLHALEYAHQRKVVHRDIKPANIRVGTDGRAKAHGLRHRAPGEVGAHPDRDADRHAQLHGARTGERRPGLGRDRHLLAGRRALRVLSYQKSFGGDTLHSVLFKVVSEQPPPLSQVARAPRASCSLIVEKALARTRRRGTRTPA